VTRVDEFLVYRGKLKTWKWIPYNRW